MVQLKSSVPMKHVQTRPPKKTRKKKSEATEETVKESKEF